MKKPTVARVQGAALGGGTGLTAACDIAIASSTAVFATSEVKFGIIPSAISPYVLRARELGLVHEVVAPDALDAKVAEVVASLLQCGPKAQAAAKDLIRAVAHQPIGDAVVADTVQRIAHLRATPEAKEGVAAFLEKRTPNW